MQSTNPNEKSYLAHFLPTLKLKTVDERIFLSKGEEGESQSSQIKIEKNYKNTNMASDSSPYYVPRSVKVHLKHLSADFKLFDEQEKELTLAVTYNGGVQKYEDEMEEDKKLYDCEEQEDKDKDIVERYFDDEGNLLIDLDPNFGDGEIEPDHLKAAVNSKLSSCCLV